MSWNLFSSNYFYWLQLMAKFAIEKLAGHNMKWKNEWKYSKMFLDSYNFFFPFSAGLLECVASYRLLLGQNGHHFNVGTMLPFRSDRNLTFQIVADQLSSSTIIIEQEENWFRILTPSLTTWDSLMSDFAERKKPVVGIFAIQGAVEEHADLVKKCGGEVKEVNITAPLINALYHY